MLGLGYCMRDPTDHNPKMHASTGNWCIDSLDVQALRYCFSEHQLLNNISCLHRLVKTPWMSLTIKTPTAYANQTCFLCVASYTYFEDPSSFSWVLQWLVVSTVMPTQKSQKRGVNTYSGKSLEQILQAPAMHYQAESWGQKSEEPGCKSCYSPPLQ